MRLFMKTMRVTILLVNISNEKAQGPTKRRGRKNKFDCTNFHTSRRQKGPLTDILHFYHWAIGQTARTGRVTQ